MNLQGIVSVTGKPGLYKVIGQNKSGFILETLDEAKNKLLINPNTRIAALKEITVFGEGEDIQLKAIFSAMKEKETAKPIPDPKADGKVLKEYFEEITPEYDKDRVYVSDIKKILSWYGILSGLPLFNEEDEEEKGQEEQKQPAKKEGEPGKRPE